MSTVLVLLATKHTLPVQTAQVLSVWLVIPHSSLCLPVVYAITLQGSTFPSITLHVCLAVLPSLTASPASTTVSQQFAIKLHPVFSLLTTLKHVLLALASASHAQQLPPPAIAACLLL